MRLDLSVDHGVAITIMLAHFLTGRDLLHAKPASAAQAPTEYSTAASGLQWADAKLGTGEPIQKGSVAIDYVMSTTGARYGAKIDSTVDRQVRAAPLPGSAPAPPV